MSAASTRTAALAAASGAAADPWVIAVVVALASFMEVLDTTIANVALPYIAGGMGVSEDEASWVVTTYLVSNAIILTASSFLARMLGRKTFFLICLGLFTLSSLVLAVGLSDQCTGRRARDGTDRGAAARAQARAGAAARPRVRRHRIREKRSHGSKSDQECQILSDRED